jgi:glycosyltransferase involved in cell wall biosynthesis
MEYPLVSAIVLCYNQAQFVVECLESVKAQNYPNLELIINDDASKDSSVAVIEAWLAKNNIPHIFLKNNANQGICRSLNNVLSHANGKYVSGIASDDVWLSNKLLKQVQLMEQMPEKVGVVYSDALQMDEQGKLLPVKFFDERRNCNLMVNPQGNVHLAFWQNNFIPPMTTMIRRKCFDRVGLYDESLFAEDWDMWLRISRFYDFAYSPEISAKYRIVNTSATRSNYGRLMDDMCGTCVKHLKSGELDPEAKRAAAARLHELASVSFREKSPRHKQNLLYALKYRPAVGILARFLLACFGGNSDSFKRVRSNLLLISNIQSRNGSKANSSCQVGTLNKS